MIMTREDAKEYARQHPEEGRVTLAKSTGISTGVAQSVLRELAKERREGTQPALGESSPQLTQSFKKAISAEDFVRQLDVPHKIREALPKLEGTVILDLDLRRELGIASDDYDRWEKAAAMPEFAKYRMTIRNKIYWGHPETFVIVQKKLDVTG